MIKTVFCLLAACLLVGCGEIRYIGIETYNPGDISYPAHVRKVLIANNAIAQSPETGCEYILLGQQQSKCEAKADSAAMDACRSLGKALVEANYFDDVLLYDVNLRENLDSNELFKDGKLSFEDVQSLCEKTNADAVIAVDRLLFHTRKEVTAKPEGYVEGNVNVYVNGIIRSYLPQKDEAAMSVLVSDSVVFSEWSYTLEQLNVIALPQPDEALRIAAAYVGEKAGAVFAPHWNSEHRWFYTNYGSKWKEATVYATAEKWTEASLRWKSMYNKTSNWKAKAKLASNLALCHELNGEMEKALELAKASYELFLKNNGENDTTTFAQSQYVVALEKRIEKDAKLNLQIRK